MPEYSEFGVLMPVFDGNFLDDTVPLTENELIWKDVIIKFLQNKNIREEYSKKGMLRAQDFSIERIREQWIKILKN